MAAPKRPARAPDTGPAFEMRDDREAISDRPVPLVAQVRPPFLLVYNPLGWAPQVVDGVSLWLPEIVEIPVIPGTNGAFVRTKDQPASDVIRSMRAYLRDERGLYPLDQDLQVPASVLPTGVPGGSWSRSMSCRIGTVGGVHTSHLTPWHRPQPALPGRPLAFKLDRVTWDRFRAWLVSDGHIVADATLEAVQAEYRRRAATRLSRVETRAYPSPDVAARKIAERRADLDMVDNARAPEVA